MAETTPAPSDEPSAPPAKKSTLIVRIGIALFLVAVVLGEVLLAYKFLSGSSGNAAVAGPAGEEEADAKQASKESSEAKDKDKEHKSKKSESSEHGKKAANKEHGAGHGDEATSVGDQYEVELGKFTVTAHHAASSSTVRIDFRLFGIIATEYKEEFDSALKANQNRFREQVLVTVRSAEGTDLTEAGLGLIKRQILEKTNTLLGKPLVRAVIITDFSHIEQ